MASGRRLAVFALSFVWLLSAVSAWSQPAAVAPLFTIAAVQEEDGVTEADLTPSLVKRLEAWAIAALREKFSSSPAAGEEPAKAGDSKTGDSKIGDLKIVAASMLFNVDGKLLAVIEMSMDHRVREVYVMGFKGEQFYRVACIRESNHEIPIFFGKCGAAVRETFGVPARPSVSRNN
jgi:hypothetical protein